MLAFIGFVALVLILAFFVQLFRRKWKAAGLLLVATFGLGLVASEFEPKSNGNEASFSDAPPANTSREPAINRNITAQMIQANPRKYVGERVQLRCEVSNVPDDSFANVECGPTTDDLMQGAMHASDHIDMSDPDSMTKEMAAQTALQDRFQHEHGQLVITGDGISSLDGKERILVTGFVDNPMDGTNLMGGATSFANVRAESIKKLR